MASVISICDRDCFTRDIGDFSFAISVSAHVYRNLFDFQYTSHLPYSLSFSLTIACMLMQMHIWYTRSLSIGPFCVVVQ